MGALRVLVTRPAAQAAPWVLGLRGAGLDAVALPLIDIAPPLDAVPVQRAWAQADAYRAWMFVSPAAAFHFFKGKVAARPVGIAGAAINSIAIPRCWGVGPGTSAMLRQSGVPAARIDAPPHGSQQFDSEALWPLVRAQVERGARVLLVRGGDAAGQPAGRPWLQERLMAAGAQCETVLAYRRLAPSLDEAALALARDASRPPALWLFSSSEAIDNLSHLLPDCSWQAARALATHARIAQRARAAGFGTVHTVAPTLQALLASIESIA